MQHIDRSLGPNICSSHAMVERRHNTQYSCILACGNRRGG